MTFEEVVSHFPELKPNDQGGFYASCPAHYDRKPSLSINRGKKGTLIYCHAGCSIDDILDRVVLRIDDLFYDTPVPPKTKPAQSKNAWPKLETIVGVYEESHGFLSHLYLYEVPEQELSFAVLRWDKPDGKKEIRPASRDSTGWRMEFPKGPRPLFGLPAAMDAIKKGEPIFVVEGEKCVLAAQTIGLVAVTSAGGSQAADKTDWSPLAGANIYILPDNDEPGHKYAREVAKILHDLNSKTVIKNVDLPGLSLKGDLANWIENNEIAAKSGKLKESLYGLIEQTGRWEPLISVEKEAKVDETSIEPQPPASLIFRTISDLTQQFPNLREPIIEGLLRRGETMNIIAPPKIGKSWLVIDLALSVAMGSPWLGYPTKAGKVLIIDNELHPETISDRIQKVIGARGLLCNNFGDKILIANSRGMLVDINSLGSQLAHFAPDQISLIVLDSFYRFMPVGTDENDNAGITSIYNLIDNFAQSTGCSFVLIHHASKGNQTGKSVTDVGSGAGSMSRAADTHLILRPHEQEDVMVMEGVTRSFKPIYPHCLRKNPPLWQVDYGLDPADLRSERPRRRPKQVNNLLLTKKPENDNWDAVKFKSRFVKEHPVIGLKIIEDAVAAGIPKSRANSFLKIAEAEKLIFRHTIGLNKPPFYATVPQPVEIGKPKHPEKETEEKGKRGQCE